MGQTVMYHTAVREREKTVGLGTKMDLGYLEKALLWISTNTYTMTQSPSISCPLRVLSNSLLVALLFCSTAYIFKEKIIFLPSFK